ncbi:MAG: hypothetical protein RL333_1936 [Pseudomonadota bacterium]|jgi:hypothetical protein
MSDFEPRDIDPGHFFVRLFYILVYLAILAVVRFVLWGVLLIQMVCHLIGMSPNRGAQKTGQVVSEYIYKIWLYLSYNTDDRPFPFRKRTSDIDE